MKKMLLILLLLCASQEVRGADEPALITGFISQSLIYSSDNNYFVSTDDHVSTDYSEAALIMRRSLGPVSGATQIVTRNAGSSGDGKIRLDYGFLTWRAVEGRDSSHSIMLGRIKVPVGFYNETRDSPFTRIGSFLPQGIYNDRIRNVLMSADEVIYWGEFRISDWAYDLKLGKGRSNPVNGEIKSFYSTLPDIPVGFSADSSWHAQVLADYNSGQMRLAYSKFFIGANVDTNSDSISSRSGKIQVSYQIISVELNSPDWSLSTEAFWATISQSGFDSLPIGEGRPFGMYSQFTLHSVVRSKPFVRLEYSALDDSDPGGAKYAKDRSQNLLGLPAYIRYSKDVSAGLSYTPNKNWLFNFEVHHIEGALGATLIDHTYNPKMSKYWNLVVISSSWRF